jgi:hypothetical protein
LIGGPSFLPLHCRVVVVAPSEKQQQKQLLQDSFTVAARTTTSDDEGRDDVATVVVSSSPDSVVTITYDFVPQNATSIETLQKLLSFQPVRAEVRAKSSCSASSSLTQQTTPLSSSSSSSSLDYQSRAEIFCSGYKDKELHLLYNNCWTFAINLIKTMVD